MTEQRLAIPQEEWRTLALVARAIDATEAGPAARLSRSSAFVEGTGLWYLRGADDVIVTVLDECECGETFDAGVALQLMRYAGVRALGDDTCDLVLSDDGFQRSETSSGANVVVDSPQAPYVPVLSTGPHPASAVVRAADLEDAIWGALQPVISEVPGQPPPVVTIGIEEDGSVGVACDWRPFGYPKATFRVLSSRANGSSTVACPLLSVHRLLVWCAEDDADILIEIGPEWVSFDVISERGWTAWCPTRVSQARWADRVATTLEASGHYWGWIDDQVIGDCGATGEEPEVRIAFIESVPELVRLTLVHQGAPDRDGRLLREVNGLNARKTEVRFWEDGGCLVASYDLPCTRHDEVAHWADRLRDETDGIGILVRELE